MQAVDRWIIVANYSQLQTVKGRRHGMQISFDCWLGIVLVTIPAVGAVSMVVPAQFTRIGNSVARISHSKASSLLAF